MLLLVTLWGPVCVTIWWVCCSTTRVRLQFVVVAYSLIVERLEYQLLLNDCKVGFISTLKEILHKAASFLATKTVFSMQFSTIVSAKRLKSSVLLSSLRKLCQFVDISQHAPTSLTLYSLCLSFKSQLQS